MEILELELKAHHFERQVLFYSKTLGLSLIDRSKDRAVFQVGKTRLVWIKSDQFTPYHFAINIPGNRINAALSWLKQRVEVLKNGKDEIQNFSAWNAEAVYFYDEDKNIVELIARRELGLIEEGNFRASSLLSISEIGVPVSDIEVGYEEISAVVDLKIYSGDFNHFCAVGDVNGLFICIDKAHKTWFPTGDRAESSAFKITLKEQGQEFHLTFENGHIKPMLEHNA